MLTEASQLQSTFEHNGKIIHFPDMLPTREAPRPYTNEELLQYRPVQFARSVQFEACEVEGPVALDTNRWTFIFRDGTKAAFLVTYSEGAPFYNAPELVGDYIGHRAHCPIDVTDYLNGQLNAVHARISQLEIAASEIRTVGEVSDTRTLMVRYSVPYGQYERGMLLDTDHG